MSTTTMLIHSLGWALIHSIWQGALILVLLRMLFMAVPGLTAKLKYHCSYLSLAALFTWFLASFFQEWQRLQAITIKITEGGSDPAGYKVFFVRTFPQQQGLFDHSRLGQIEGFFPWIIIIYSLGVLFLSVRFIVNLMQVQLLRRNGILHPSEDIIETLEHLKKVLGIERNIRLQLTQRLSVPVVFGTLKPVILLPVASVNHLSTDQLEAILIHELAHVKRNDYLLNIFQTIAETILFFNPFTWLISSVIRREREHCCDDLVLAHTSHPLPYAKALAALEAYRLQPGSFALATTGSSNHLLNRIKRIMEMKNTKLNYSQMIVAFILIAVLAASAVWLTPAFAQGKTDKDKRKNEKASSSSSSVTRSEKIVIIDDNGKRTEYRSTKDLPVGIRENVRESMASADVAVQSAGEALKAADKVLKEIDIAGITKDALEPLEAINWEDIGKEVDQAMKEIDWEKINNEIALSLKEAEKELKDPELKEEMRRNVQKAQAEACKAMAEAKREMAGAKREMLKMNKKEYRKEVMDAQKEMMEARKEMVEARREIAEAREEEARTRARSGTAGGRIASGSGDYDEMLHEMEADGLISKDQGFDIKKYNGRLYINGHEQDGSVYNKYRRYLKGNNITIKGDEDDLSIRVRN